MISEEANELNTFKKRLSCNDAVKTGSGQKTALSTHSPQECVEETHKTITRQTKYDWYHGYGKCISWPITGTTKMITWRRCSSKITRASGYGRNMIHYGIGRTQYGSMA